MSPAAELVLQARAAGVIIGCEPDGTLRLRAPRSAADLARAVREREAEVLALLAPRRRCYCGATVGVRHYITGYRCPAHTPAALAGEPEPDPIRPARPATAATAAVDPALHPWPAHETGPCAGCRSACHRYGPEGGPLCAGCPSR